MRERERERERERKRNFPLLFIVLSPFLFLSPTFLSSQKLQFAIFTNFSIFLLIFHVSPCVESIDLVKSRMTRSKDVEMMFENSETVGDKTVQKSYDNSGKVERAAEVLERTFVTALEGSKTSLLCDVRRPVDDTIEIILWFRGTSEEALYSIDARRTTSMRGAKHFQGSDEFGDRVKIDLNTIPTRLNIESVKGKFCPSGPPV